MTTPPLSALAPVPTASAAPTPASPPSAPGSIPVPLSAPGDAGRSPRRRDVPALVAGVGDATRARFLQQAGAPTPERPSPIGAHPWWRSETGGMTAPANTPPRGGSASPHLVIGGTSRNPVQRGGGIAHISLGVAPAVASRWWRSRTGHRPTPMYLRLVRKGGHVTHTTTIRPIPPQGIFPPEGSPAIPQTLGATGALIDDIDALIADYRRARADGEVDASEQRRLAFGMDRIRERAEYVQATLTTGLSWLKNGLESETVRDRLRDHTQTYGPVPIDAPAEPPVALPVPIKTTRRHRANGDDAA